TAGHQANLVRERSVAIQLAQSKMAEFSSGALSMSSQGGSFGDEAPGWEWEVEASQHSVTGLWNVTVRVHRSGQDDSTVVLSPVVLAPSKRGHSPDAATLAAAANSSSSDSSSPSSPSSPSSGQPGTTTPAQPATGGGTGRPATGGATAPATGGGATGRPA